MIQKIFVSSIGWAVIMCPKCGQESHHKPSRDLLHKVLEKNCRCGAKFQVMFDTRSAPRVDCAIPGILATYRNIAVEINHLSERGACFEVGDDDEGIETDSVYNLKMKINDAWIEVLIRIVGINRGVAGFEFVNPGFNQKKAIESFLLSNSSDEF